MGSCILLRWKSDRPFFHPFLGDYNMSAPKVTYGNNQIVSVIPGQLNGYEVDFAGISQQTEPFLTLIGSFSSSAGTTLSSVAVASSHALAYGSMSFFPLSIGVIANGVHLSYGNLTLNQQTANVTLLHGSVNVGNGSTANFEEAQLSGGGTFNENSATAKVALKVADSSLHVTITQGMLSLKDGMSFLGTIREGASGTTEIFNASAAVKETFNQSTGVLDLLNSAGANVASVKFTGSATLYATPDAATGAIDITNARHTGSLPVVFSHGVAA
jgi:hypothetical protein